MCMDTVQGMEALQRGGNLLSSSSLVPEVYRRWKVEKDGTRSENPSGLANCVVALNMATRIGMDPIMCMQNLNVIEGRPSWSSVFIIASINQCGKFSPLRFDLSPLGDETEANFKYTEWEPNPANPGKNRPVEKTGTLKVKHQSCRAWAIEKATGQRLDGPEITIQMALDEGWIQKRGSKWRTMQEVMLRYRAASMFGKLYAPELLLGLQSAEEVQDVVDVEVIEEDEPRQRPPQRTTKQANHTGWTIEAMEAWDGLMENAYGAFKDAGYQAEYQAFHDIWHPKRGKSLAEPAIAELKAAVDGLVAAAADSDSKNKKGPAQEQPTGKNPDEKLRSQVAE